MNGLWNVIKMLIIDELGTVYYSGGTEFYKFSKTLWHDFFKEPIDQIPHSEYNQEQLIRAKFFNFSWYEVYDFVEFIIEIESNQSIRNVLINSINGILEREFSGYRIINEKVAPISNQIEFEEVTSALERQNF